MFPSGRRWRLARLTWIRSTANGGVFRLSLVHNLPGFHVYRDMLRVNHSVLLALLDPRQQLFPLIFRAMAFRLKHDDVVGVNDDAKLYARRWNKPSID